MRILKDGDKSQAVCPHCKRLRDTTYRYDKYSVPDQKGKSIDNVLQGFCDICGSLAAIPAQSSPKIRLELRKNDTHVEARVTPPLEDVLFAVSSMIRVEPQLTMRMLINFFSQEWMQNPSSFKSQLKSPIRKGLLLGKASCRVSSKMDVLTLEALNRVQERLQVSRTELFKAVLIEAGIDLVERSNSATAKRFFKAASLLGSLDDRAMTSSSRTSSI